MNSHGVRTVWTKCLSTWWNQINQLKPWLNVNQIVMWLRLAKQTILWADRTWTGGVTPNRTTPVWTEFAYSCSSCLGWSLYYKLFCPLTTACCISFLSSDWCSTFQWWQGEPLSSGDSQHTAAHQENWRWWDMAACNVHRAMHYAQGVWLGWLFWMRQSWVLYQQHNYTPLLLLSHYDSTVIP